MDLSQAPIRVMEPAIVERLRLAFPSKVFAIERVPQTMTIKEFERHANRTPFIGLAWTGMRPDTANARILKGHMLWRLILIFRASNTLETRFKGDRKDLGLDAMIDVAIVLLQGAEIPGVGVSNVTLANSVIADGFADEQIVIAQVDFEVAFSTTAAGLKLKTAEDFKTLAMTWAVSANPDAPTITDEIELPQEDAP